MTDLHSYPHGHYGLLKFGIGVLLLEAEPGHRINRPRRDDPVGVPLDLSTMEWHELPKYNGIQVSQLIYIRPTSSVCCIIFISVTVCVYPSFSMNILWYVMGRITKKTAVLQM